MTPGPCSRAAPAAAQWWVKGRCALVVAPLSKGGISWVSGAHRIGGSEQGLGVMGTTGRKRSWEHSDDLLPGIL